jgi:type I restriction enzyme S subunit
MPFKKSRTITIGELGDFANGVNFSKEAMGTGWGLVNVKDIFRSGIRLDFSDLDKVDVSANRRIESYSVAKDDLFFVRSSVKRDGIGLVSYSPSTEAEVVHCGFVIRLRVKDSSANPVFLAYALRSPYFREVLKAQSSGTAIVNISQQGLGAIKIDLPPASIQNRIVEILSRYDDLIENNTRRIRILEEMARIIYREWFVRFRFPGHEGVQMINSEMGPIPKRWEASCVGNIASGVRNSTSPRDLASDTPYVGLEHIPRESIALSEWGSVGDVQSTKLKFNCGDILFGKIRPYFHKVVIAPVAGVCSSDAIVIVPKKAEYLPLVLCCVSSKDFVAQATQTSQGTKMPRANWDVLTRYPVPLPEESILSRFNAVVRPMIELINNLVFGNRSLRQTRDLLLPKLISGEISAEQCESEVIAQSL